MCGSLSRLSISLIVLGVFFISSWVATFIMSKIRPKEYTTARTQHTSTSTEYNIVFGAVLIFTFLISLFLVDMLLKCGLTSMFF